MEEETGTSHQPTKQVQNRAVIMTIEGSAFKLLKQLEPYDLGMPILLRDSLSSKNVRGDFLITPVIQAYLIMVIDRALLIEKYAINKKSLQKTLIKIVNIEF